MAARVDAAVMAAVARRELDGSEVAQDRARVAGSAALLAAVAAGNPGSTWLAVHALVYHPLWHIVRLRVSDLAGTVLADIGGPDVASPVSGALTFDGQTIGRYVISVQDDAGVVKLEHNFIGDDAGIYRDGSLIVGSLAGAAGAAAGGRPRGRRRPAPADQLAVAPRIPARARTAVAAGAPPGARSSPRAPARPCGSTRSAASRSTSRGASRRCRATTRRSR